MCYAEPHAKRECLTEHLMLIKSNSVLKFNFFLGKSFVMHKVNVT